MVSLAFWNNIWVPTFPFWSMWDWKEATIPQQWAYRSPVASGKGTLKDTTTGCTHRGQGFLQRKPECFYRSTGRHWTKIDSGFTTCSPVITASPTHVDFWIRKIIGSENCILSFIKSHIIWIILLRNRQYGYLAFNMENIGGCCPTNYQIYV